MSSSYKYTRFLKIFCILTQYFSTPLTKDKVKEYLNCIEQKNLWKMSTEHRVFYKIPRELDENTEVKSSQHSQKIIRGTNTLQCKSTD